MRRVEQPLDRSSAAALRLQLELLPLRSEITVTASRGFVELPPPQGTVAFEHTRTRFWWRTYLLFAGSQNRLSGGDIDDERIGASRSRSDIAAVFESTRLSPLISQGIFTPTGETLRQIQDRVLPGLADSARVALYDRTPGWLTWNLHGGYSLAERVSITGGVFNILDRNYRVHGSGTDAPGVSVFLGFRFRY